MFSKPSFFVSNNYLLRNISEPEIVRLYVCYDLVKEALTSYIRGENSAYIHAD
jgi:hypothetical protein